MPALCRTTPGEKQRLSKLAIETALILAALLGLSLRQIEVNVSSIMEMMKIDLAVPDHTTLAPRRSLSGLRSDTTNCHLAQSSTDLTLMQSLPMRSPCSVLSTSFSFTNLTNLPIFAIFMSTGAWIMVAIKEKTGVHSGGSQKGRVGAVSPLSSTAFVIVPDQNLPKGMAGFKLKVSETASKALAIDPKRVKALLQGYGDAIVKSRSAGRPVSFRVDVEPDGETIVTPVEEAVAAPTPTLVGEREPDPDLQAALGAARTRGRLRAADILADNDMLSADDFAKMLGTTRVTVNAKRQNGQVLGLDGAKRGFRFPIWQLDGDGKPFVELVTLHERLGGPWAVYRFLVQPHGELSGLSGREALERGKGRAAVKAAESVGRAFR